MKIDENVIYKESYKAITEEDWYLNSDVTGKEVGEYILGISVLTQRLLEKLGEEDYKEETE